MNLIGQRSLQLASTIPASITLQNVGVVVRRVADDIVAVGSSWRNEWTVRFRRYDVGGVVAVLQVCVLVCRFAVLAQLVLVVAEIDLVGLALETENYVAVALVVQVFEEVGDKVAVDILLQ